MSNPVTIPVAELIVRNVVETVAGISEAAGYLNTLSVERQDLSTSQAGISPRDRLAIVIPGDALPQPTAPVMHDEFVLPIGVCVYAVERATSAEAVMARLYSIAADVRRALTRDVHRGVHPGHGHGLACNTTFEGKDEAFADTQPPRVLVTVSVRYRTLWNDPFRQ